MLPLWPCDGLRPASRHRPTGCGLCHNRAMRPRPLVATLFGRMTLSTASSQERGGCLAGRAFPLVVATLICGCGGGGGDGDGTEGALVPEPEKKKGFWGKLGSGLKKVGQIALPFALSAVTGGIAGPLTKGLTGAGQKIGQSIAGGLKLPK